MWLLLLGVLLPILGAFLLQFSSEFGIGLVNFGLFLRRGEGVGIALPTTIIAAFNLFLYSLYFS